jgi:hypothetical protein
MYSQYLSTPKRLLICQFCSLGSGRNQDPVLTSGSGSEYYHKCPQIRNTAQWKPTKFYTNPSSLGWVDMRTVARVSLRCVVCLSKLGKMAKKLFDQVTASALFTNFWDILYKGVKWRGWFNFENDSIHRYSTK